MKTLAVLFLLALPNLGKAQTSQPCGVSASGSTPAAACIIRVVITPGTGPGTSCSIALGSNSQKEVTVPAGVEILWTVSGVGDYFVVALQYGSSVFGNMGIFFKGGAGTYTGAKAINSTAGIPISYYVYAVDSLGSKCALDDPKVIISPAPIIVP